MKILIISTLAKYKFEELRDIRTRIDMVAYSLYINLKEKEGMEVLLKATPHKIKKNMSDQYFARFNYPISDHAIVIYDKPFQSFGKNFLKYLSKITKGSVCSVSNSSKGYGGEDFMFTVVPSVIRPNIVPLNYAVDYDIFKPKQNYELIRIVIGEKYYGKDIKLQKKDKAFVLLKSCIDFMEKNIGVDIEVCLRNSVGFDRYKDSTFPEKKTMKGYGSRVDFFGKTHIYFVSTPIYDPVELVELTACNVLIVSPTGYVSKDLVKKLSIFEIDSMDVPWQDIFTRLNNHTSRDDSIGYNFTTQDAVRKIVLKLYMKSLNRSKNVELPKTNSFKEFDECFEDYCKRVYKPKTLNLAKFTKGPIDKPKKHKEVVVKPKQELSTLKKPRMLLQSQLRRYQST